jgi:hypothetical protein
VTVGKVGKSKIDAPLDVTHHKGDPGVMPVK